MEARKWEVVRALMSLRIRVDSYQNDSEGICAVIGVPFNCWVEGGMVDYSNREIANLMASLADSCRVPIFGQWEHLRLIALSARYNCVPRIEYPYSSGQGEHVQSHQLIKWQAERVTKLGRGKKVGLIAHPDHLRRCAILCGYYGLEPVLFSGCQYVPYDGRLNREGVQIWTTSKWLYRPWELLSRLVLIYYILTGKI